jgi:hypothetical protein
VGIRGRPHDMLPSEIKICDLGADDDDKTPIELVMPEIQRRLVRAEKFVKKAPYVGGGLICEVVNEIRRSCTEVEDAVKRRQEKLPAEFVTTVTERVEALRDECNEVLRDADLM